MTPGAGAEHLQGLLSPGASGARTVRVRVEALVSDDGRVAVVRVSQSGFRRRAVSPQTLARYAEALDACRRAGLVLPADPSGPLPDGVGTVAAALGVTRQAFSGRLRRALVERALSGGACQAGEVRISLSNVLHGVASAVLADAASP